MADSAMIVGVLSFAASVIGTFGGILVSSKLTTFRIEQLERKVQQHNNMVERTYILEEKMKVANHRIDDLEGERKHV